MHRNYYSSNFGNVAAAANAPTHSSSRSSHSNSNSNNYHKYDHLVNGNPNLNMRSIYENYLSSRHIDGHTNYTPAATTNLRYDDNDYPIPTSKIQYYAPEPPVDYGYSGCSAKSLPSNTSSYSSNSSLNRYRNRDSSDNNLMSSSSNTNSVLPLALSPTRDERETSTSRFLASYDPLTETENLLRLKWLDNSPRMSRLREHRQKRLMNKLEVRSDLYRHHVGKLTCCPNLNWPFVLLNSLAIWTMGRRTRAKAKAIWTCQRTALQEHRGSFKESRILCQSNEKASWKRLGDNKSKLKAHSSIK